MTIGSLVLHRFNGEETYPIVQAGYGPARLNTVDLLRFGVVAGAAVRGTNEATRGIRPNAEIYLSTEGRPISEMVGAVFTVPTSWDDSVGEHVTAFYYFEHEEVDGNRVEILAVDGSRLHVRWIGTLRDPSCDESTPPARLELTAWFDVVEHPVGPF